MRRPPRRPRPPAGAAPATAAANGGGTVARPRQPAFVSLRGEVGSEQEMSFNRLAFGLAILAYLLTAGRGVADVALPALGLWGYLALGVFLHNRFRPGPNTPRRAFALLLDMGFLSWFLHAAGEEASGFFLVYLWIVLGNGVRFGVRWLFAAMGVFLAGFGAVALTTPFWREQPHLTAGLVVGPCVLALYAASLIRKLSDAGRRRRRARPRACSWPASATNCARR